MEYTQAFDAVVVGGGPAGATAAHELAKRGHSVLLLDRAGRIKPCGGAIPPRLIRDFDIPDDLLVARALSARMIAPSNKTVDIPIDNGFVGMVDREHFDEWLRCRAASAGALRQRGTFDSLTRDDDGMSVVNYTVQDDSGEKRRAHARARIVVGADGARSEVARQAVPEAAQDVEYVFAYHEIVRKPDVLPAGYDATRCDVFYQGHLSPDFYGWVFPHGDTLSIGTGSADKGFSLRGAVSDLRGAIGLKGAQTVRREGAPLPMKPLKKWDNGRDVVLAGDAAGVVAPSSGEGIYYAMLGGQLAAQSAIECLRSGDARVLAQARKRVIITHHAPSRQSVAGCVKYEQLAPAYASDLD